MLTWGSVRRRLATRGLSDLTEVTIEQRGAEMVITWNGVRQHNADCICANCTDE